MTESFGAILRRSRLRVALSQNKLARCAGIDPAYVNRMERAPTDSISFPSRKVVLALAEAVDAGPDDRERLLVAAGHCPEVIVQAGGWDAYRDRFRTHMDNAMLALEAAFRADAEDGVAGEDILPFVRRPA